MDQGRRMASNEPNVSSALTSVHLLGSSNEASNKYRKRAAVENEEEQRQQAHTERGPQPHVDKAFGERPQAQDKCLKKPKVLNGGEQSLQPQLDREMAQRQVGEGLLGHQPRVVSEWRNAWEKYKEMVLNKECKEQADADMESLPPGFEQLPPVDKGGKHDMGGEQEKGWRQQPHIDKGWVQEPQVNKRGEQDKGWGQWSHVDKGWGQQSPVIKGCKQDNGCGQQSTVDKGQGHLPHIDKGREQHLNKGWGQNMKWEQKADVETGSGQWPDVDQGWELQTQIGKGWGGQEVSKGWGRCQPAELPRGKNGWEDHLEKPCIQDGWGKWRKEQSASPSYSSNDPVYIAVSALKEMMNSSPEDHRTPSKDLQVIQTTENTITKKVFSIKLLIDNKAKKVLFAETGKEVIDFLFNLLALPVASLIEFITKKNMVGSMGNLYDSVESINSIYLQPNLDKTSLLKPVVVLFAGDIPLLPPSVGPRCAKYYRCSSTHHYCVTSLRGTLCPKCHRKMMIELSYLAGESSSSTDAGYVKGGLVEYLLTDDMYVMPLSAMSSITLLKKFNVVDITFLEEKIVDFGMEEGLEVLKAALQSKTVLTEVFPLKETAPETRCDLQPVQTITEAEDTILSENTSSVAEKVFSIKILTDSKARRVLFAEAEKELIDFLFSLLALPVASIVELINKKNMPGSMGNLYESVENFSSSYIQPNVDKKSLLRPQIVLPAGNSSLLPPTTGAPCAKYYVCSTNSHHSHVTNVRGIKCPSCPVGNHLMLTEISYVAGGVSDVPSTEDGYVRGELTYVVTDELVVIPTHSVSSVSLLKNYGVVDVNILEEKTFDFGIQEGLEVLKASLTSKTVLTDVFWKKIFSEMQ